MRVNDTHIDETAVAAETARMSGAPDAEAAARRALVIRELLLQRAGEVGLLEGGARRTAVAFASREAEDALIERLLESEVRVPAATPEECRRHYEAHPERFGAGALVEASHILFAVTRGTPVALLRAKAEETLAELRAHPERFAQRASELSNCPSGAQGGNLGQFGRGQMVPEFETAVFGNDVVGVLPQLVATRYGFHIVRVDHRIAGRALPFEQVERDVAVSLEAQVTARALRQYVEVLAGRAEIEGVDIDATASPLVQ